MVSSNEITLSIVVPTYNEALNVKTLIERIHAAMGNISYEVVVVDDNSPDGTWKIASELSSKYPVNAICRKNEKGLASAVLHGLAQSRGEYVCVIDSDLSHPPEIIPQMLKRIQEKTCDAVVASRYTGSGSVEEWPLHRKIISFGATLLAKPLTSVSDPMSGFFLVNRSKLRLNEINPIGYKILLEVLVKSNLTNVEEIPYTFVNRAVGKSNLGPKQYVEYVIQLSNLAWFKVTRR